MNYRSVTQRTERASESATRRDDGPRAVQTTLVADLRTMARWQPAAITASDLVRVGCEHRLHVTHRRIRNAVAAGELVADSTEPLTFTPDAANAWLTALKRAA